MRANILWVGVLCAFAGLARAQEGPKREPQAPPARVRLVRLQHAGDDWDKDLGKGKDHNLLLWYNTVTGRVIGEPGESVAAAELREIPVDDPLFARPFALPAGAPPLWHHSGTQALGIRVGDRWAVFYHPGEMLDAWKDSHSGAPEAMAIAAYKLGFNLIAYAYGERSR